MRDGDRTVSKPRLGAQIFASMSVTLQFFVFLHSQGQKQTFAVQNGMSAVTPIADKGERGQIVR
jgi:VanZ family protein